MASLQRILTPLPSFTSSWTLSGLHKLEVEEADVIAQELALPNEMARLPVDEQGALYQVRIVPPIGTGETVEAQKEPLLKRIHSSRSNLVERRNNELSASGRDA